jgi:hypothetical protein
MEVKKYNYGSHEKEEKGLPVEWFEILNGCKITTREY